MPTNPDPFGDDFIRRLSAELTGVRPPSSTPRYLSTPTHRIAAWRLAPAGLAAGVIGLLGVTAYAATGSPNPVVWTQQIVTKIEPTTAPEPKPVTTTTEAPEPREAPQPTERAEPTERPEPAETSGPARGDDSGSPEQSTKPSSSPGDR